MTKHALLASVFALGLLPVPASAAEWTGLYVGLNAGGIFGDIDLTGVSEATTYVDISPGDVLTFDADGVLGGAQLGYNFAFSNWLIGVDLSGQSSSVDDRVLTGEPNFVDLDVEWLATASLRLGFVLSSSSLLYLKGGYATAQVSTHYVDNVGATPNTTGTYDTDEIHQGFVIGAGVEHMISQDVSFGAEYNYVDIGEQNHSAIASGTGGGLVVTNVEGQLHTVTARLNWHFWSP